MCELYAVVERCTHYVHPLVNIIAGILGVYLLSPVIRFGFRKVFRRV